jgi:hypothetical protein
MTMTMAGRILSALAAISMFGTIGLAAPTTQPVSAKVLKVEGKVQYATIGKNNWTFAKAGDVLTEGMEIRTFVRASSVLIRLHNTTLVQILSASRVSLNELARTTGKETTRIFLHRGTIRAGIVEGALHSDFQIACPAAVLSREGTWGIEMNYDPATGHFYVGLDTEGLIRVLNLLTGQRRTLTPGQFLTQAMQQWITTAVFQRTVLFTDPFGTTSVEISVYANNSGGRTVADPTNPMNLQSQLFQSTGQFNNLNAQEQLSSQVLTPLLIQQVLDRLNPPPGNTYEYRYGNFGTDIPDRPVTLPTLRVR